jgi:myo-inositol-1(or 4)-monophosphatase
MGGCPIESDTRRTDVTVDACLLASVAREAAETGARVAMEWLDRADELQIEEKSGPRDLVSRADRDAEAAIRSVLSLHRPHDGVLGEEGGQSVGESEVYWAVDPIDGTTSYLYGRADWAVSVAAMRCSDRRILAGAVVEPMVGKTTVAAAGGGTYTGGQRVVMSDDRRLDEALIEVNLGREDQRPVSGAMIAALVQHVRDVRRGGSAASALAQAATGRADAVWAPGLQPWDCAAGVLLVAEAGGLVGDLTGTSPGTLPISGNVLAAGPQLWAPLSELLRPIYVSEV